MFSNGQIHVPARRVPAFVVLGGGVIELGEAEKIGLQQPPGRFRGKRRAPDGGDPSKAASEKASVPVYWRRSALGSKFLSLERTTTKSGWRGSLGSCRASAKRAAGHCTPGCRTIIIDQPAAPRRVP